MRALIGLLVLGCLFVMAASWQNRTTAELQSRRNLRYAAPADAVGSDTAGWSRLILGRPSGAEALPVPEEVVGAQAPWPDGRTAAELGEAGVERVDFEPVGGAGSSPGSDGDLRAVGIESTVASRYARDFEYVVRANDSLSVICQKHYEERPLLKLVEAVALYNDLKSPDSIREGHTILLPDAAVLFPE